MPFHTIYTLGASDVQVTGGQQLSGITQGDGSHLQGETITLLSNNWEAILVDDNDASFADNDASQTLEGAQSLDGINYADGLRVEAEFSITVQDPNGVTYEILAFNINEPGSGLPSYGTVEGLAFVGGQGGFPPVNTPLTVVGTGEGPSEVVTDLATPICFGAGTLIETPSGPVPVEDLSPGDQVLTLDHGAQVIRGIGHAVLPRAALEHEPHFRPIRVLAGAFGPGKPDRDLLLSPQHRVLITGWEAELLFGAAELLVPIVKLVNDRTIRIAADVAGISYYHLLLDRHEILRANGLESESCLRLQATVKDPELRPRALMDLFTNDPDLPHHQVPSRICLSSSDTALLRTG